MSRFFEAVYQLVCMIPSGKVASYGQIADFLGHPRGARTVGWALHDLPGGMDVPWHRVVNARGCISTPSDAAGTNLQRELLESEGIVFDADGCIDMARDRWEGPSWDQLHRLSQGE